METSALRLWLSGMAPQEQLLTIFQMCGEGLVREDRALAALTFDLPTWLSGLDLREQIITVLQLQGAGMMPRAVAHSYLPFDVGQ